MGFLIDLSATVASASVGVTASDGWCDDEDGMGVSGFSLDFWV